MENSPSSKRGFVIDIRRRNFTDLYSFLKISKFYYSKKGKHIVTFHYFVEMKFDDHKYHERSLFIMFIKKILGLVNLCAE